MSAQTSASGASNGAPGPNDQLSKKLVGQMQTIFGKHPGYRTTHAKGLLVEGKFTPTEQAKTLSIAQHFNSASTPVIARFSVGGGIPHIPDADNGATPKGVAVRFLIDDKTHTDLISHSFDGFAVRTGEDFSSFLGLLTSMNVAQGQLDAASKKGANTSKEDATFKKAQGDFFAFLGTHKSAAEFVKGPKPNPLNYGTLTYYEVNTHVLTNAKGEVTNVRYRLVPADGDHLYTDSEELKKLAPDYLEDDLQRRFPQKPIVFTLRAHIAGPNDVLDDATVPYKSTTFIDVGKLEINKVTDDNAAKSQQIAFSPTPDLGGVKGIRPSADPLIQARKGVYYISVDQRRHEKRTE